MKLCFASFVLVKFCFDPPFCAFEVSCSLVTQPVVVGHPASFCVMPVVQLEMSDKVERPNTLIVTIPDELSAESHAVIVDKLISSLGADGIRCVQFVPRNRACVTFTSFEARNAAFLSGVHVGSIRLSAVEVDPVLTDVQLEHLPVEVPDDVVSKALRPFGAVHGIVRLKYAGTSIYTGTRSIKMALASDIPVNFRILRYSCRVFYRNQPRPCSICRSSDHRNFDCPLRDVCRLCRMPGHFARDCPEAVLAPPDPVDIDDDDDNSDEDYDPDEDNDDDELVDDDEDGDLEVDDEDDDDDDDVDDDADDFASGDDEVSQSAPVLSGPRLSRSSANPASAPAPAPVPATAPVPAPVPARVPTPVPASAPAPAATTVPASSPVPMDVSVLLFADRPQWIVRAPDWVRAMLSKRFHSSDTHLGIEEYRSGTVRVAFDFGRLTYRLLTEKRFLEEDRFMAYLTGVVSHPVSSSFAVAATNLPSLPADVVPARFPG